MRERVCCQCYGVSARFFTCLCTPLCAHLFCDWNGTTRTVKYGGGHFTPQQHDDGPATEGRVLIERTDQNDQQWCRCGQCEDMERSSGRICCRHHELRLENQMDAKRCITETAGFHEIVLNPDVLLTVFIHVMLVRRQRGAAPSHLSNW